MRGSAALADERGVATLMLVMTVPLILLFCVLAIDVSNWFVHKRQLQTQADAAALAGAGVFQFPNCDDSLVTNTALRYSGIGDAVAKYNDTTATVGARLHAVINGPSYHGQAGKPGDADLVGGPSAATSPCTKGFLDVKMTETDLPFIFGDDIVPNINAEARVQLFKASQGGANLSPLAVPEPAPSKVRAYIVDESTGATVKDADGDPASVVLSAHGTDGALQQYDNESSPLAFTPPPGVTGLGVRLALSGSGSTQCGDELVTCVDSGATTHGLTYLRAWSDQNVPATDDAPVARSVTVDAATCSGGSLVADVSACTVTVNAKVKWNPAVNVADLGVRTKLTAKLNGVAYPMTHASGTWTAGGVSVPAGAIGPRNIDIDWEVQVGSVLIGGRRQTCSTAGSNKCVGTFDAVQRVFWNDPTDQASRGGQIGRLEVLDDSRLPVSDLQRCSATHPDCTTDLTFEVGIKGSLGLSRPSDPPVAMRIQNGNLTQLVDCDPAHPNDPIEQLSHGCGDTAYAPNAGTPCTVPTTPLSCVPVETGIVANKPAAAFNFRFMGDERATTCPSAGFFGHNNWPDFPTGDPRLIDVFIVPFGAFNVSNTKQVQIVKFGSFYVTGYASSGQGFNNPCIGAGDQFVPGTEGDNGVISGHFVKPVKPNENGASTTTCEFTDVGACVAVLVK